MSENNVQALQKHILVQREKIKRQQEELAEQVRKVFAAGAKEMFKQYPDLEYFAWTQYTPYFNDGDPCTFRTNTDYLELKMQPNSTDETTYYTDHFFPHGVKGRMEREGRTEMTRLEKVGCAVSKFLEVFEEDDFLNMFGDHARVIVTREGVTTELYDHG